MSRIDFNNDTKKTLAMRAAYKCSICGCLTVGPTQKTSASNMTGVAAHIAAASIGGKRYRDLPEDSKDRSSIENGIWLCATHAKLIDGDDEIYTSKFLKELKEKHEYRVGLEHRGVRIENGLITKIGISNFGLIRNYLSLEFENKNLIFGANGVGKTLICEMIASLTNNRHLDRWHKRDSDRTNSICSIYYYKNDLNEFKIVINAKSEISLSLNEAIIPFLSAPFKVFYMTEDIYDFRNRINKERDKDEQDPLDESDLLSCLSLYFKLSLAEFSNVIDNMARERKFFINDIRIDQNKKDIEVLFWGRAGEKFRSFRAFSGGEKQRIILDIALRIASYYAKFQTTIFLLENTAISIIDDAGINQLLEIVNTQNLGFQFFFTTFQKSENYNTTGYCTHELIMYPEHEGSNARDRYVTSK